METIFIFVTSFWPRSSMPARSEKERSGGDRIVVSLTYAVSVIFDSNPIRFLIQLFSF